MTKVVTGTALMRLARTGVLGLDDPLERWLPWVPACGITLRHLAEHTSGLPRLPPGTGGGDPYRAFDAAALGSVLSDLATLQTTAPGRAHQYSNLGYAVLGEALCAAAGSRYEELVRALVLDPLGIAEMTAHPPPDRCLTGAGVLGRPRRPWTLSGAVLPAGGLWATPTATARLVAGLLVDGMLGEPAPTWLRSGDVIWHNGTTHGVRLFAGARADGHWVLVHRLGGPLRGAERLGNALLAAREP